MIKRPVPLTEQNYCKSADETSLPPGKDKHQEGNERKMKNEEETSREEPRYELPPVFCTPSALSSSSSLNVN